MPVVDAQDPRRDVPEDCLRDLRRAPERGQHRATRPAQISAIDGAHMMCGSQVCRLLRMMRYEEDVPSLNQRRRAKKRQLERFITTAYRSAAHAMQ